MDLLFIHQNFPGQYPHLASALRDRGVRVAALGGPTARPLPGIPLHRYDPMPAGGIPHCHPWAADLQTKCLRAEAVAVLLEGLLRDGLKADLVIGHPGWGELMGIKDLLPEAPVLHQVEFVYQLDGADLGFDRNGANPVGVNAPGCGCAALPSCWPSTTSTGAWHPPVGRPPPLRNRSVIGSA
jgi:hypothetical protein